MLSLQHSNISKEFGKFATRLEVLGLFLSFFLFLGLKLCSLLSNLFLLCLVLKISEALRKAVQIKGTTQIQDMHS